MSEERKTLAELLKEYRDEIDPTIADDARKLERGVKFVEDNRSGLVSAMIKATRMRKLNHALYYAAVLLIGQQDKWYISRRVGIMSCEDGIDDVVMKYVSDMHQKKKQEKSIKDILKAVAAINLRPNWWEVDYGRELIYGCFREKKVDLTAQDTEDSLVELMYRCLFEEHTLDAWTTSSVIIVKLMDEYKWSLSDLHAWLLKNAKKNVKEEWEAQLIDTFKKMTPDMTKFGDGNWHYNFRYMFCMGRNPHVTTMEQLEKDIEEVEPLVDKILEVAKEKFDSLEIVVPPWAFDGMHASKRASYGWADKRFPGSYAGFYNCIKMYDEYGRVDPRDQGMLDGCQVPEEGLVMGNEFLDSIEV